MVNGFRNFLVEALQASIHRGTQFIDNNFEKPDDNSFVVTMHGKKLRVTVSEESERIHGHRITTNIPLVVIHNGFMHMDTLNIRNWLGQEEIKTIPVGTNLLLLDTKRGVFTGDQCYVAVLNESGNFHVDRDTYYMDEKDAKKIGLID